MSAGRAYRRRLGRSAVFYGPPLDDNLPPRAKEAIVRRRLTVLRGRCPCGAVSPVPESQRPGTVTLYQVAHEPGCPAGGTGADLILVAEPGS